jgi:hypothetical protein
MLIVTPTPIATAFDVVLVAARSPQSRRFVALGVRGDGRASED